MDGRSVGMLLLLLMELGLLLVVVGRLAWSGWLGLFGRLPGDFQYEGEHAWVYVPWVSCLVASVTLSLLAVLARKFF